MQIPNFAKLRTYTQTDTQMWVLSCFATKNKILGTWSENPKMNIVKTTSVFEKMADWQKKSTRLQKRGNTPFWLKLFQNGTF